jgi:hypothetical protein
MDGEGFERPPLVLIEWEDSAQAHGAWQWLEDIQGPSVNRCYSAGFLLKDGKNEKRLAISVGGSENKIDQASGVIAIPARCIRKIKRLKG